MKRPLYNVELYNDKFYIYRKAHWYSLKFRPVKCIRHTCTGSSYVELATNSMFDATQILKCIKNNATIFMLYDTCYTLHINGEPIQVTNLFKNAK